MDRLNQEDQFDPFFELVHDGDWNACVGRQGNAFNYVEGYLEAARELVDIVIEKRLFSSRDTLVLPILFNCRHSLELALKIVIGWLQSQGVVTKLHPQNHDLLSHWVWLSKVQVGDRELASVISAFEPYVKSLAAVDESGQELRYATTSDGTISLKGLDVVNLELVRQSILRLSTIVSQMITRLSNLEDERQTNTYTRECSRADLEMIAGILGFKSTWASPTFVQKKGEIQKIFGLSGKGFSRAVTAIKSSGPLASIIGLETSLRHVSDDKAVAASKVWSRYQRTETPSLDPNDAFPSLPSAFLLSEMGREIVTLGAEIAAMLSREELADLEALYYIGRDRVKGEHYEDYLSDALARHLHDVSRTEKIRNIMSKTNFLDMIAEGASLVGRPSLACKLRSITP